jgi:hypothetical protein
MNQDNYCGTPSNIENFVEKIKQTQINNGEESNIVIYTHSQPQTPQAEGPDMDNLFGDDIPIHCTSIMPSLSMQRFDSNFSEDAVRAPVATTADYSVHNDTCKEVIIEEQEFVESGEETGETSIIQTPVVNQIPNNLVLQNSLPVIFENAYNAYLQEENHVPLPVAHVEIKGIDEDEKLSYIKEELSDGSKFEGYILLKVRHGKGRVEYSNGMVYDGEFHYGKKKGKGTLLYPSGGICYDGQWNDNSWHGIGVLHNENQRYLDGIFDYSNFDGLEKCWMRYEGSFIEGRKEGEGVIYLTNGEKYVGWFRNDVIEGPGDFYRKDNVVVSGVWSGNRLVAS